MIRNSNLVIWFLAVVLALSACNRNALYSRFQPVDIDGWQRADTVCFETSTIAHAGHYSEALGLRINSNYPFTQLTLIVDQKARPSGFARTDTIDAVLTDKEGLILGKGINLYLYNLPLPEVKLLKDDTLSVCVHHDMLRDPLPGIADVGFTLTKE